MTRARWLLVAGLLVVGLGVGLWVRGWFAPVVSKINPAHEQRAAEDLAGVEQKDAAIRGLSAEITKLRAEADRQGRARAAAEQQANAYAERAKELGAQLARIEAERKALARATSIEQVREALARRGIVAR